MTTASHRACRRVSWSARSFFCAATALAAVSGTQAQQASAAPTSAQRWGVRFLIERFAPDGTLLTSTYNTDPITYNTNTYVGRVDITYQGRVGILPNTAGDANLGISRLGGAGSATTGGRIQLVDSISQGQGLNQGTVSLAQVPGNAAGGQPNRGLFQPFRGSLAGWSAASNGSNTDANNGSVSNHATATPVVFNFSGGRTVNFGTTGEDYGPSTDNYNGSGPIAGAATINGASLDGAFANYYKVSYFPRLDSAPQTGRLIQANVFGQTGRYLFRYSGGGQASNGANFTLPNTTFTFAVVNSTCPSTVTPASQVLGEEQTAVFATDAVSLSAGPTYHWFHDGVILHDDARITGTTTSRLQISTLVVADSGTYSVSVDGPGCTFNGSATLNVPPTCTATTLTQQPVGAALCPGAPITFSVAASGTSPIGYQWRRDSLPLVGEVNPTLTIASVSPLDAAVYDCVASNACGQATSTPASLSVVAPPLIFQQPTNRTVCTGGSTTLSAMAAGTSLSYQWRHGGISINGATQTTYTIPVAFAEDAGTYDLVATGPCGNVATSNSALVTVVSGPPTITTQPTDASLCEGGSFALSVATGGGTPVQYQWRRNGSNIGGATAATYTVNNATVAASGQYDVVVTNACSSVTCTPVQVSVAAPPAITSQPMAQVVCAGSPLSLSVATSLATPPTFQWRRNSVPIPGATAAMYSLGSTTPGDAGKYDVVVTNACSSTTSQTASVVVTTVPAMTAQPSGQAATLGVAFSLSAAASGDGLSLQWRKDAIPLSNGPRVSGATTPTLTVAQTTLADGGSYDLVATNPCGQVVSSPAAIDVGSADLQISDVVLSGDATPGRTLTVSYAQHNDGTRPVLVSWVDRLVLSRNEVFGDADDVALDDFANPPGLAQGANQLQVRQLTLPAALEPGAYRIVVIADAENAVQESIESNNSSPLSEFAVSLPDLSIAALTSVGQGTIGKATNLQWTVRSIGQRSVVESYVDRVILSLDAMVGNADDRVLLERPAVLPLVPGEESARTADVAIPSDLSPGGYHLFVAVDALYHVRELDETNNAASLDAFDISGPDLTVSALQGPNSAVLDEPFEVRWRVYNAGARVSDPRLDRVIVSLNSTLGDDDDLVLAERAGVGLAPGNGEDSSAIIRLPAGSAASAVNVFVVTNADHTIVELSNDNNSAGPTPVIVAAPDLSIVSVAVPPTARSGMGITVPIRVANSGTSPTAVAAAVEILLSTSTEYAGPLVGQAPIPTGLAAGATVVIDVQVTLPINYTDQGTRYLVALADTGNQIAERDETNNIAAGGFELLPTPSVDLIPTAITAPSGAEDRQSFSFSWTVRNQGQAAADGSWVDRVYLTRSPALDASAVLVRTLSGPGSLAAGTSYARVEASVIPAGLAGTFYLILQTNATDTINEPAGGGNNVLASAAFQVSQPQLPDLLVSMIALGTNRYTSQPLSVTYSVVNSGPGTVNAGWTDRVYFGPDSGMDPLSSIGLTEIAQFTRTEQIRAQGGYANTTIAALPATPGRYRVLVRTDDAGMSPQPNGTVLETDESNNARVAYVDVVAPEYSAIAATAFSRGPGGATIQFAGSARLLADNQPAPNADVDLVVQVRDVRRVQRVRTDAGGTFVASFASLPNEAGLYRFFAKHPAGPDPSWQGAFVLDAFTASPQSVTTRLLPGEVRTGTIRVTNNGDAPIDDLRVVVADQPSGIQVTSNAPLALPALGFVDVPYQITAQNASETTGQANLTFSGGAANPVTALLRLAAGPAVAQLIAAPSPVVTGMVRGEQRTIEVTLRNTGGRPTGALSIAVPAAPWLFLSSPSTIPSLAPNASAAIVLTLLPTASTELGPYAGAIAVNADNASLSIPFSISCISSGVGSLTVNATDEFTYYGIGNPQVANARITLRDVATNEIVRAATTDAMGFVHFADLPEARYNVEATADRHGLFRGQIEVHAARANTLETFLPRQFVTYEWSVVPVTTEDRYRITVDTTFETDVPAPVLTVDPPFVDLTNLPSEGMQVNFVVRNRGLIAARSVTLNTNGDENVSVTALVRDIGTLPPNSQVTVPVTYMPLAARSSDGVTVRCWRVGTEVVHLFFCGTERRYQFPVIYRVPGCGGGESGPAGQTGGGGVNGFIHNVASGGLGGNGTGGDPTGQGFCFYCEGGAPRAEQPGLQVPEWLQTVLCCASRNGCIKALIDCVPAANLVLSPLADFVFLEDDQDPGIEAWVQRQVTKKAIKKALVRAAVAAGVAFPPTAEAALAYNYLKCSCNVTTKCPVECITNQPGDAPCSELTLLEELLGGNEPERWMANEGSPDDVALSAYRLQRATFVALLRPTARVFGSAKWLAVDESGLSLLLVVLQHLEVMIDSASDGGEFITDSELAQLSALALPPPLEPRDVTAFVERHNRTLVYAEQGIVDQSAVPDGESIDFVARDYVLPAVITANEIVRGVEASGGGSVGDVIGPADNALQATRRSSGQGVCSQVRVQIDQELAVTREAFSARLVIANSGQGDLLTNVVSDLHITDAAGNDATAFFALTAPTPIGFGGSPGNLAVSPGTEGTLQWLIVPSSAAAPIVPTQYFVSGSFAYSVAGESIQVPLYAAAITVVPNPSLRLKYFLEREVFSDDPFTQAVEPAVPFALGLIVTNGGAGSARNVRITSAQPEIVQNDRDLLIDFKITGTELNANPGTLSLMVNFGDIGPGQRSVAQFMLTASLQGKFSTYHATFENLNGLGKAGLSIIDSVDVFPTVHVVRADGETDDGLPDFLTDQVPDVLNLPDTVHLSSGPVLAVTPVRTFDVAVDPSTQRATLATGSVPNGYFYIRVSDPFNAALHLVEVRRSDGKVITLGKNAWQTSKINRDGSGGVTVGMPERYVHLFDTGGTGAYTLVFSSSSGSAPLTPLRVARDHGPAGEQLIAVTADGKTVDPRAGGLGRIVVRFTEPVNPDSFTPASLAIWARGTPDGGSVDLTGTSVTTALSDGGLTGTVVFGPPLPGRARYCVDLREILLTRGGSSPDNGRFAFVLLTGDSSGDQRVNNSDVGAVLSKVGTVLSGTSSATDIRADINLDGIVDNADVTVVLGNRRLDIRSVGDACAFGAPLGPQSLDADGNPHRMLEAGSHPVPSAAPTWLRAKSIQAIPSADAAIAARRQKKGISLQLPPGTSSDTFVVTSSNAFGEVVGYGQTAYGSWHAFRYTPVDGEQPAALLDLGTLGGVTSRAFDINNAGRVIGSGNTLDQVERPAIFMDEAGLQQLGPPSNLVGAALAVNEAEWSVGYALDLGATSRATMWIDRFGAFDLNALAPTGSGWVFKTALGFDSSDAIVGHGMLGGVPTDFRIEVETTSLRRLDVNLDGVVNPDDLGDFIAAYFSPQPDPVTDFNGDGMINPDDLGDYITSYFTPR
ncbi:MAG: CARDB domain-containing protein [Phycisphaerales bacterium]